MLDGFLRPHVTWLVKKEGFWPLRITRAHDVRRQRGDGFCKRGFVVMQVCPRLVLSQLLKVTRS